MKPWKENNLELFDLARQKSESKWPPRILFGKGIVTKGEFQPYMPLSDYIPADFLCDIHRPTPAAVRFSLASGSPGSGDTCRDIRAMEVKLYTKEGNCALTSLSLPEGICISGGDFFALLQELEPSQRTGLRDQCGYLRYASFRPQALSGVLRLYGRRGIPGAYASMESWSAGTILWRNQKNQRFFVRHRWVPEEKPEYLSESQGEFLCGFDPDSAGRRLWNRFEEGRPAVFELRLQLLEEKLWKGQESRYCDEALAWPKEEGIHLRAGRLTLNRVAEPAVFAEQLFCCSPGELAEGMELIEGSYLHQMAVISKAMQQTRLGREQRRAAVNLSRAKQRPAVIASDVRLSETDDEKRKTEYYRQAKAVWEECSPKEREGIVRAISQRLLFGEEDLQRRFLKEMENVDRQIAKQIENQFIF